MSSIRKSRIVTLSLFGACLLALSPAAQARQACGTQGIVICNGSLSVDGCREGPWDWTCQIGDDTGVTNPEFSHAALIPKGGFQGRVLLWRNDGPASNGQTTATWFFDPANPARISKLTDELDSNIFCSGLSWDRDGNLAAAGGGSPIDPPDES